MIVGLSYVRGVETREHCKKRQLERLDNQWEEGTMTMPFALEVKSRNKTIT
ncbi:unnamed protein product [Arabidopsis lyrata]|nr:unnamed protein product [Arabidopsis lyrata]